MATGYADKVFINCPFDEQYTHMLQALVFTIYRCGFLPITAMNEDNATDNRLDKLVRLISEAKFAVHDLSRLELNTSGFPRFNMPFELGLYFGAKKYGGRAQKAKSALVFERVQYQYQQFISDLNGIDTKAHDNNPHTLIRKTRSWLNTESKRVTIPGHQVIIGQWDRVKTELADIANNSGLDQDNIAFNDLSWIIEKWLTAELASN